MEVAVGNDKKNGEEEKGFVVKDKRFSAKKEERPEPQAKEEGGPEEAPGEGTFTQEGPLPEIDFTHFIFSLSTSALIQLGEVQDPFTEKQQKTSPWPSRRSTSSGC